MFAAPLRAALLARNSGEGSRICSLDRAFAYDKDRNGRFPQDDFGNAAKKQMAKSAAAVRAHHDEVSAETRGEAQHLVSRDPATSLPAGGELHPVPALDGLRDQRARRTLHVAHDQIHCRARRCGSGDHDRIDDRANAYLGVLSPGESNRDLESLLRTGGSVERDGDFLKHGASLMALQEGIVKFAGIGLHNRFPGV